MNNPEFEQDRGDVEAEVENRPPFPIGITSPQLPGEVFKPGSPTADVVFVSVYDARPLNGQDFMVFGGDLSCG
jgi:hypothetical protein